MSATPGMPEYGSIGDRLKNLEAQVAKLNRARSMRSTSLDGGTFRVKNGGTIEILDGSGNVIHTFDIDGMTVFEADGSTLMELDGTGIVLNDGSGTKLIDLTTAGLRAFEADGSTLLVLDGSKLRFNRSDGSRQLEITPGGGLKVYESDGSTVLTTIDGDGVQVGDDVKLDAAGLANAANILTVDQNPVGSTINSTSFTTVIDADISIPSAWSEYEIEAYWQSTVIDVAGGNPRIFFELRLDTVTEFVAHGDPDTPQRIVLPAQAVWTGETTTGTRTVEVRARLSSTGMSQEVDIVAPQFIVRAIRTA